MSETNASDTDEPGVEERETDEPDASESVSDESDAAQVDPIDISIPEYFLNRELSELAFQRRVLYEALDDRNPLLERVKFLAIFATNMDEFFMKRIGGLKQQIDANVTDRTPDGRSPYEQWTEALETARPMFERHVACYRDDVGEALADAEIHVVDYADLADDEQGDLRSYFEQSVLPTLTPLTFDPAHPFPFISNGSLSLAVLTRDDPDADVTFSRVKIPKNRPRFVQIGEATRYVALEDIVAANLDLLFPDVEIIDYSTFRVTRNAEVRRNEEIAEDLVETIEEVLRERRFATVVRLEVERGMPGRVRELLVEQLDLDDREVFELEAPLDLRDLFDLLDVDRPALEREPWTPQPHPRFPDGDDHRTVFDVIRERDVLVHHPYHSFTKTVQHFLEMAATDPDVLAIKVAIYRTARDSKVIESLLEAARNGKQVAVMVELKARFDERNNLEWVEKLEEEGIHVAYGTIGYKTHSKVALVVREEPDGVQLYTHVATGNYHSETAKTYTDLGLLTADRDVGYDVTKLFNFFTGLTHHEDYRKLLVAPGNMRERFTDLIRREATIAEEGGEGRIVVKMNALEDPDIVVELYRASRAGVEIDLVVRDICRLRPGLENVSETISVYSVVGRFLEHSRVFAFGNDGDPEYYLGSADWMTRNLDNRVETVVPIEDPTLQAELRSILDVIFDDNRRCWEMAPDGTYEQREPDDGEPIRDTHEVLSRRVLAERRTRSQSQTD